MGSLLGLYNLQSDDLCGITPAATDTALVLQCIWAVQHCCCNGSWASPTLVFSAAPPAQHKA